MQLPARALAGLQARTRHQATVEEGDLPFALVFLLVAEHCNVGPLCQRVWDKSIWGSAGETGRGCRASMSPRHRREREREGETKRKTWWRQRETDRQAGGQGGRDRYKDRKRQRGRDRETRRDRQRRDMEMVRQRGKERQGVKDMETGR